MGNSGDERSRSGLRKESMLSPILTQLNLVGDSWNALQGATVKGKSGLDHRFDFLLSSKDEPVKTIVCMILEDAGTEGSARLSTFYAHAMDVSADRMIVLTSKGASLEQRMLSTSLGIELFQLGDSGRKDSQPARPSRAQTEGTEAKASLRGRKKYRDRTQIVHEILTSTSAEEGATITRIIFRCNLNYNSARAIIEDMVKKELIAIKHNEENKKVYRITKMGSNLLEKLHFYDSINGTHSVF